MSVGEIFLCRFFDFNLGQFLAGLGLRFMNMCFLFFGLLVVCSDDFKITYICSRNSPSLKIVPLS